MTNPYAYSPEGTQQADAAVRWARTLLTVILVPIGMKAFGHQYAYVPLLSGINLAVHEFGHHLFQPFGWAYFGINGVRLGGSLFEAVFPLIFVGYFLWGKKEHRDLHAAMVCLWWASMAWLSVAVYVADARARRLMLISGATGRDDSTGHDWYNLLRSWGVLQRDTVYAGRIRATAVLMFGAAILVGLWAIWIPRKTARSREETS